MGYNVPFYIPVDEEFSDDEKIPDAGIMDAVLHQDIWENTGDSTSKILGIANPVMTLQLKILQDKELMNILD